MAYNNVISRADAAGTIPVEYSNELLGGIAQESFLMRMARRLRNMTVYEEKLPVLSALATAYFPGGDTGLVQTSEINWEDVVIYAEDLAVIVPVSKNVLNDSNVPIWNEVKSELITAAGVAVDNAQLYGTNKPSTWPTAIVTAAASASHNVSEAAYSDLYEALLGETAAGVSGLFGLVEEDGYAVNGSLGHLTMKRKLRNARDANGIPIFSPDPAMPGRYLLDGAQTYFPTTGIASATYKLIAGDWQQLCFSMRQDIEFEVFTEGVIQDAGGSIVYNLITAATRYPFAYLTA